MGVNKPAELHSSWVRLLVTCTVLHFSPRCSLPTLCAQPWYVCDFVDSEVNDLCVCRHYSWLQIGYAWCLERVCFFKTPQCAAAHRNSLHPPLLLPPAIALFHTVKTTDLEATPSPASLSIWWLQLRWRQETSKITYHSSLTASKTCQKSSTLGHVCTEQMQNLLCIIYSSLFAI